MKLECPKDFDIVTFFDNNKVKSYIIWYYTIIYLLINNPYADVQTSFISFLNLNCPINFQKVIKVNVFQWWHIRKFHKLCTDSEEKRRVQYDFKSTVFVFTNIIHILTGKNSNLQEQEQQSPYILLHASQECKDTNTASNLNKWKLMEIKVHVLLNKFKKKMCIITIIWIKHNLQIYFKIFTTHIQRPIHCT